MVSNGHLINREISIKQFQDFLTQYSDEHVYCTEHTFFRLSEKQRKLFKCEEIKVMLFGQTPVFVGIQNNNNYTVFYKIENQDLIRIVLDIQLNGRGKGESDYDYKHDILFFKTKDREYSKSLELHNIILDTDNEGFITGMQILDASNFLQVKPMILKNIKNFEFNAHNEHGKIEVRLTFQMQIRNKIVEKNPIILQETPMYLPSSTLQVSA